MSSKWNIFDWTTLMWDDESEQNTPAGHSSPQTNQDLCLVMTVLCLLDHRLECWQYLAIVCAECKIYCGKCFTINNILIKLDNTFDT